MFYSFFYLGELTLFLHMEDMSAQLLILCVSASWVSC